MCATMMRRWDTFAPRDGLYYMFLQCKQKLGPFLENGLQRVNDQCMDGGQKEADRVNVRKALQEGGHHGTDTIRGRIF